MAHLIPHPFGRLVTRVLGDLERGGPVLDLPAAKIVRGVPGRDTTTAVHGHRAATPLGPAAGPHTQLAQNIVLGYLGGCRVFELKTVQILDELAIPRPCIDLRTVGFNVEWSQELKLEQSLDEYVKASMLLEILIASGHLALAPGFEHFVFDLSVGYDLQGIQSPRVRAFLDGMLDATAVVDRLRAEIPEPYRRFADLPFRTRLSDTLTLSTFHGCPPSQIEGICTFLMEQVGLHTVVKLNPTLLGAKDARGILNDALGYRYQIPDSAFAQDPTFDQASALITRLEDVARRAGKTLGVKFSNTLVVENEGDFLPKTEKLSYLSGPPLHVLAMTLVGRFRAAFGDRLPISFSAGIDRHNFADAVSLGLKPVTVCSDLLRTGGYGRLQPYFGDLARRMEAVGAATLDAFVLGVAGPNFAGSVSDARLLNTRRYVDTLLGNPRYASAANSKPPNKVGSKLALFDCLTCDKCVPVCPNDANFTYVLPAVELPVVKLKGSPEGWTTRPAGTLKIAKKHQLATFADFCNECGNCDVFCPEDGGPYVLKPRFFGSAEQFLKWKTHDGVFVERGGARGRFNGNEYRLTLAGPRAIYAGQGFELELDVGAPHAPRSGHAEGEVDLTYFHILTWLHGAIVDSAAGTWVAV